MTAFPHILRLQECPRCRESNVDIGQLVKVWDADQHTVVAARCERCQSSLVVGVPHNSENGDVLFSDNMALLFQALKRPLPTVPSPPSTAKDYEPRD